MRQQLLSSPCLESAEIDSITRPLSYAHRQGELEQQYRNCGINNTSTEQDLVFSGHSFFFFFFFKKGREMRSFSMLRNYSL